MKLKDYLKQKRMTWQQFADLCDLSRQTIYHALLGKDISMKTIKRIEEATNSKVGYRDLKSQG
jgi:transcriptional regulator with XRE-family HTH domain